MFHMNGGQREDRHEARIGGLIQRKALIAPLLPERRFIEKRKSITFSLVLQDLRETYLTLEIWCRNKHRQGYSGGLGALAFLLGSRISSRFRGKNHRRYLHLCV